MDVKEIVSAAQKLSDADLQRLSLALIQEHSQRSLRKIVKD